MGSGINLASQKVDDSLHGEGSSCFPRMHSSRYENNWLLESKGSGLFREELIIEKLLILVEFVLVVVGGDGEEVNLSFLRTEDEDFLVEVELVAEEEVVEGVKVLQVFGVGEGISEGEEDGFLLISELILENTLQF